MSGFTGLRGTYAGRAAFRPDLVLAPVCCLPPPPQADNSGAAMATPATDAAVPTNFLRLKS